MAELSQKNPTPEVNTNKNEVVLFPTDAELSSAEKAAQAVVSEFVRGEPDKQGSRSRPRVEVVGTEIKISSLKKNDLGNFDVAELITNRSKFDFEPGSPLEILFGDEDTFLNLVGQILLPSVVGEFQSMTQGESIDDDKRSRIEEVMAKKLELLVRSIRYATDTSIIPDYNNKLGYDPAGIILTTLVRQLGGVSPKAAALGLSAAAYIPKSFAADESEWRAGFDEAKRIASLKKPDGSSLFPDAKKIKEDHLLPPENVKPEVVRILEPLLNKDGSPVVFVAVEKIANNFLEDSGFRNFKNTVDDYLKKQEVASEIRLLEDELSAKTQEIAKIKVPVQQEIYDLEGKEKAFLKEIKAKNLYRDKNIRTLADITEIKIPLLGIVRNKADVEMAAQIASQRDSQTKDQDIFQTLNREKNAILQKLDKLKKGDNRGSLKTDLESYLKRYKDAKFTIEGRDRSNQKTNLDVNVSIPQLADVRIEPLETLVKRVTDLVQSFSSEFVTAQQRALRDVVAAIASDQTSFDSMRTSDFNATDNWNTLISEMVNGRLAKKPIDVSQHKYMTNKNAAWIAGYNSTHPDAKIIVPGNQKINELAFNALDSTKLSKDVVSRLTTLLTQNTLLTQKK